jgi:hypothetical protein
MIYPQIVKRWGVRGTRGSDWRERTKGDMSDIQGKYIDKT